MNKRKDIIKTHATVQYIVTVKILEGIQIQTRKKIIAVRDADELDTFLNDLDYVFAALLDKKIERLISGTN